MRIQHNITAMNSYRNYAANTKAVSKNLEKLSSGYRINRAGDDAAGLAISEKMRAQITGLKTAQKNAKDGISLVQTAEGALTEVHSMLNRMVELADQSANGTYDDTTDRANLQKEISQLTSEVDRIADSTNFNGIKLLNGELGQKISDVLGKTLGSVDFSDGMDITSTAGEGAKSKFEIKIDEAFSEGDTITINYNIPTAGGGTTQKSLTLTHDSAAISNYAGDNALTFTGETKEAQINSIMQRLSSANTDPAMADFNGKIKTTGAATGEYTISASGNTLSIEAFDEAKAGQLHITGIQTTNQNATVSSSTVTTNGANLGSATMLAYKTGIKSLVTGTGNIQAGDTLRFKFNLGNSKTGAVDLKITADMIDANHEIMTQNIANALADAKFSDDSATNMDESQFKVSDYFDVHANAAIATGNSRGTSSAADIGNLQFTLKDPAQIVTASDFQVTGVERALSGSNTFNAMGGLTAVDNANTTAGTGTAEKEVKTLTFTNNFGKGDMFQLEGKLTDGRTFKVMLEAGGTGSNGFAIGADLDTSLTNIANALKLGSTQVSITNRDGSDAGTMTGDKVFDTNGASGMTIAAPGAGASTLTVTNTNNGVANTLGVTGSIDDAKTTVVNAQSAVSSGIQVKEGKDVTNAKMTIDFNDLAKLEYGSAFTLGKGADAKTFELVSSADAETTQSGNIRVVVSDLANASGAAIAEAARNAINKEISTDGAATGSYTAFGAALTGGTQGSTATKVFTQAAGTSVISLESVGLGSAIKAIDAKHTYGVKENTTLNFNKDDSGKLKLKAGDTIEINGQTYQFDNDIRNMKDSKTKMIRVTDFNDPQNIAAGIKQALAADDPSVDVKINENGTVTLSSKTGNASPKVELGSGASGLTLQIGDTSDSYNRLTVSVGDMHAKNLGIGDIDISTQEGGTAAIDKIKAAINSVSGTRGDLGAAQNRLEHTINNLSVMAENIQDAESSIRDVDVADEMMNYTKNNILVQSAQAMLAQANQLPQGVLQLLG